MTVTFVTALYLPTDSSAAEKYMKLGVWLVTAQVPLWIYTTPCLATRMRQEWSDISHVTIIDNVDMEAYWTQEVTLPEERNVQKDTPFYMSVQLTKLKVCSLTSQTVDTEMLCWLDFGLFHIFQDKPAMMKVLKGLAAGRGLTQITSPGGYDPVGRTCSDLLHRICWKNLGGVLIGPTNAFAEAYARQRKLVELMWPRLLWEVNYWAVLTEEGLFDLYEADHNESILANLMDRI
jgi:hypothetical protein